jgi:hypothetical protein
MAKKSRGIGILSILGVLGAHRAQKDIAEHVYGQPEPMSLGEFEKRAAQRQRDEAKASERLYREGLKRAERRERDKS